VADSHALAEERLPITRRADDRDHAAVGDPAVDVVGGHVTRSGLECGLEVSMSEHLGYEKHAPAAATTARRNVSGSIIGVCRARSSRRWSSIRDA
jgi:hypothetical protein